ncbi:MAG: hypothetical protein IKE52_01295 [Mogibacterium sp.]|nr:hypothetical protein [Mogibacterium sp.]
MRKIFSLYIVFVIIACMLIAGCAQKNEKDLSLIGTYSTTTQESEDCYYVCVAAINKDEPENTYAVCVYKQSTEEYYIAKGILNEGVLIVSDDEGTEAVLHTNDQQVKMEYDEVEYTLTLIDEVPTFINNEKASESFAKITHSE